MLKLPKPGAARAAYAGHSRTDKTSKDMIVSAGVMMLQATQCMLVVMVQHGHVQWYDPCTRMLAPDGSCFALVEHTIDRATRHLQPGATCVKFRSIVAYARHLLHGLP